MISKDYGLAIACAAVAAVIILNVISFQLGNIEDAIRSQTVQMEECTG